MLKSVRPVALVVLILASSACGESSQDLPQEPPVTASANLDCDVSKTSDTTREPWSSSSRSLPPAPQFVQEFGPDGVVGLGVSYEYEGDRLVSIEFRPNGESSWREELLYDSAGFLLMRRIGDGQCTAYSYDQSGRLRTSETRVVRGDEAPRVVRRSEWRYDEEGRLIGILEGSPSAGSAEKPVGEPDLYYEVEYDPEGLADRIALFASSRIGREQILLNHDDLGRLAAAKIRNPIETAEETFGYDAVSGHLTSFHRTSLYIDDGRSAAEELTYDYSYDTTGRLAERRTTRNRTLANGDSDVSQGIERFRYVEGGNEILVDEIVLEGEEEMVIGTTLYKMHATAQAEYWFAPWTWPKERPDVPFTGWPHLSSF